MTQRVARHLPAVEGPFSLPNPFRDPLRSSLTSLAKPLLERSLALDRLNRIYAALPGAEDARDFCEKALTALGVRLAIDDEDLAGIPRTGPLVVVANHPFGGLDGLALCALVRRVRPDFKMLGNLLLRAIPELAEALIHVDPFGGAAVAWRNATALRAAVRWVRSGGALGIFPAGEVSHLSWSRLSVSDPPWSGTAGRLIRSTGAPVVKAHFEGRNSAVFQAAGLAHPRLRTALLPRELLKRRARALRIRVGGVIAPERLARFSSGDEIASYLRVRSYILESRGDDRERTAAIAARSESEIREGLRIVAPVPVSEIARELAELERGGALVESGPFVVFCARAGSIPAILREIGRLREIAFRRVGEGTGREIDLDRFDESYLHLFVAQREKQEIVGAYRMGPTDEILPRYGIDGLYTSTLFRYRRSLLEEIGPSLELGRSFVRPEYQRSHSPLALLWRGIGRFVVLNPRYRRLFGPVSISTQYRSMSRQLLLTFLLVNRYLGDLGRLIRPRNRPRFARPRGFDISRAGTMVKDLEEVDVLIREIEDDRKSMPILLRQYLKLNGMLLGFNVDPEFGNVLDGLMLVDLETVDRGILSRFMDRHGADAFLSHGDARRRAV